MYSVGEKTGYADSLPERADCSDDADELAPSLSRDFPSLLCPREGSRAPCPLRAAYVALEQLPADRSREGLPTRYCDRRVGYKQSI